MSSEELNFYKYRVLTPVSVEFSIAVGSLLRLAVMSMYGKQNNHHTSSILSGKDSNGRPLSDHKHAFYVPFDDDHDGFIDHLYVLTAETLTNSEVQALRSVNKIYSQEPFFDIGLKSVVDSEKPTFLSSSSCWISATPFVLYRHVKKRRGIFIDTREEQLYQELKRKKTVIPTESVFLDNHNHMNISGKYPLQFLRTRKKEEHAMPAFEVVLKFESTVPGPILIGYGCHFGLGLFVPFSGDVHD